MDCLDTRSRD